MCGGYEDCEGMYSEEYWDEEWETVPLTTKVAIAFVYYFAEGMRLIGMPWKMLKKYRCS